MAVQLVHSVLHKTRLAYHGVTDGNYRSPIAVYGADLPGEMTSATNRQRLRTPLRPWHRYLPTSPRKEGGCLVPPDVAGSLPIGSSMRGAVARMSDQTRLDRPGTYGRTQRASRSAKVWSGHAGGFIVPGGDGQSPRPRGHRPGDTRRWGDRNVSSECAEAYIDPRRYAAGCKKPR